MNSRKTEAGRYEYEIEPCRWVSRQRIHQLRDKKAFRARRAVAMAIKQGTLKRKPCEICGKPNAQSHHFTYDDPFAVNWLCFNHHKHPKPHRLKGAPIEPGNGKAGRPRGKWISPEQRIINARRNFCIDAPQLT